jgi:hypothetical protein
MNIINKWMCPGISENTLFGFTLVVKVLKYKYSYEFSINVMIDL